MSKLVVAAAALTLTIEVRTPLNIPEACGTGTVVHLKIEEKDYLPRGAAGPSPISGFADPVYTVTFVLDDTAYTAESAGKARPDWPVRRQRED